MTATVRDATAADAESIATIYRHHVLNSVATYDTEPPSTDSMRIKAAEVQAAGWPFLVIERDGEVAGYAYTTQIRPRPAYRYTAEDSIYIDHRHVGQRLGHQLLATLIERTAAAGFHQMIAVIGGAEPASVGLHGSLGFREVGRLSGVGFKFGRWLDNVYMQRALVTPPAAV